MLRLTDDQLYSLFANVNLGGTLGFSTAADNDVAARMVAIALRESGGDPYAFNGNTHTGDRSFGLTQINMRDPDVAAAMSALLRIGETVVGTLTLPEEVLFHPAWNALAALKLSNGGNPKLLNIGWYIDRTGPPYHYAERYQAMLPRGLAAGERWRKAQQ